MTPVDQDMNHPRGNCLQAAVASALDLPLSGVPDFAGELEDNHEWMQDLITWATSRGLGVVHFNTDEQPVPALHNVWVVACGYTKRGDVLHEKDTHAIVAKAHTTGREMFLSFEHDPHPSRAFLDNVAYCFFFVKQ